MARSINTLSAAATIYGIDPSKELKFDETGMPMPNVVIKANGNPSETRAFNLLAQHCKSKNVMVHHIDVDTNKLKVPSDVFLTHSKVCEKNVTYGHDYVVQTFKKSVLTGFYKDAKGKMHQFEEAYYVVTTVMNKLLNLVKDAHEDATFVMITKTDVVEEKRYMTKEEFMDLAKNANKKDENEEK